MNIAITGASGFIGSHLTIKLLDLQCKLFLISNSPEYIDIKVKNKSNVQIIAGNIGQIEVNKAIVKNKIDTIVNLFAQTDHYFAESNILKDYQLNVLPVVNLLSHLIHENHKCTFIQIGTVTQCGLTPKTSINENFHDVSFVSFYKLSDSEINYYINHYKPFDKAGSYGIQDYAGLFVKDIKGSYDNIVGFPSSKFYQILKKYF